jgi:hypothetical protein
MKPVDAVIRALALGILALALGPGCHITNYELIVDNDQVRNGGSGVVNTNGKAHIRESSQVATLWSDGSDESIFFVDQKANGDRTLTTYNNFSTGTSPTFHDDLYCNPDWQGCAVFSSDDPEVGDVDIFDYEYNRHCDGARSFSDLLATSRYYGECGRSRISLADRIALVNLGRVGTHLGVEALFYDLDRTNTRIELDNLAGTVVGLPVHGRATAAVSMQGGARRGVVDLRDPLLSLTGRAYADFLDRHATRETSATVTYHGITFAQRMAGRRGEVSSPERVLANVRRHY